jgi:putative transposase
MKIPESTYYYKQKKDLAKAKYDADIADAIEEIATEFPSYGYRRVTAALKRKDIAVNHKKVLKIMKNMGIQGRKKKRFVSTTYSNHNLKVYPNLAKDLVLNSTDKLWCADITYIRILTGFVYLAALIDAFSRKIVGYALGRTLAAELAIEALKMSIAERNTDNLIHHSDKGIQYPSYDYINLLKSHEIKISTSAKGCPYDNIYNEAFFKILKSEEVYL